MKNFNKLATFIVCCFFFVTAIPHTIAAKYILLGLMLVMVGYGICTKALCYPPRSPIIISLSIFFVIALISALTNAHTAENLQYLRKDYAPPLLILIFATSLKLDNQEKIKFFKNITISIILGFMVKTALALWDGAVRNPLIFSPYSNPTYMEIHNDLPKYVSYYAIESSLYLMIVYSTLLYLAKSLKAKLLLIAICCTSFFMILTSGIRTALLASALGLLAITIIKYRTVKGITLTSIVVLLFGIGAALLGGSSQEFHRYTELISFNTDSKARTMSGRYQIWEGMSEITAQRPILGFGPGWQKLAQTAKDTGLLQQWKNNPSEYTKDKVEYFSLGRGKTNPHSLVFQILFETGYLGLICYITLFLCILWGAGRYIRWHKGTDNAAWLAAAVIGYMGSYAVLNVTNGLLLHSTMVGMMLIVVLLNNPTNADSERPPSLKST